jgi:hypothetical protein
MQKIDRQKKNNNANTLFVENKKKSINIEKEINGIISYKECLLCFIKSHTEE